MRIDYNVLWFENEEGWLRPTMKNLESYLSDLGFKLKCTVEKDNSNLEELLTKIHNNVLDIDLIFMDYRLAREEKGDLIIERIRQTELFTEIIFYSQNTDVKAVMEEKLGSVEGIYYSERDIFLDKAKNVIRHTVKKVQEVNSMRGLIMSAVSDLDESMVHIISSFYRSASAELKAPVTASIFESVEQSVNEKKEKFDDYRAKDKIEKVFKDSLLFDTSKKAIAVQQIINLLTDNRIDHLKGVQFIDSYKKDVIAVRNNFAHVSVIIEDGVKKLKSKTEEVFTDERCVEIRKTLIKHLDDIEIVKGLSVV